MSVRLRDFYSPNTEETSANVTSAKEDEVIAAVENAAAILPAWSSVNLEQSAPVMFEDG
ncbi:MAG: hypothetical protein AAFX52_05770 [Pseudomonadota bacterium]